MELIIQIISAVYNFLWGDLFTIPLPGGGSAGISLLVLLLIPTGIYFPIRTRVLPIRLFPEMLRLTVEIAEAAKKENGAAEALVLQAEMEEYTSDAQNFSKGLEMVLGDVVGTGTEMESTQP